MVSELELDQRGLNDRCGNINLDAVLCVRNSLIAAGIGVQTDNLNLNLFNTLIISDNSRIWVLSIYKNYITNL